ncbi:hypothetical protein XHV734_4091 [Xanthomonas hortorum pv. vitians]|nr:hypothetical protein XHV734_4091 [Xanthomonas hortorum pv. vitians]
MASDSGDGSPAICRSLPSATDSSHSLPAKANRLAAWVLGWMRRPASLSSGWATSAISGNAGICSIAARSRFGEMCSSGARGASTTACSALEGNWYPLAAAVGCAAGVLAADTSSGALSANTPAHAHVYCRQPCAFRFACIVRPRSRSILDHSSRWSATPLPLVGGSCRFKQSNSCRRGGLPI